MTYISQFWDNLILSRIALTAQDLLKMSKRYIKKDESKRHLENILLRHVIDISTKMTYIS